MSLFDKAESVSSDEREGKGVKRPDAGESPSTANDLDSSEVTGKGLDGKDKDVGETWGEGEMVVEGTIKDTPVGPKLMRIPSRSNSLSRRLSVLQIRTDLTRLGSGVCRKRLSLHILMLNTSCRILDTDNRLSFMEMKDVAFGVEGVEAKESRDNGEGDDDEPAMEEEGKDRVDVVDETLASKEVVPVPFTALPDRVTCFLSGPPVLLVACSSLRFTPRNLRSQFMSTTSSGRGVLKTILCVKSGCIGKREGNMSLNTKVA